MEHLVNNLHPRLLSAQWVEPLPQNWSDEPPSETNPLNPENGKKPGGGKIGGKFHLAGPVTAWRRSPHWGSCCQVEWKWPEMCSDWLHPADTWLE